MSDKFFVDTNILIYPHDTSAGVKRTIQVVNPLLEAANRQPCIAHRPLCAGGNLT
jgi:hypothetical protein